MNARGPSSPESTSGQLSREATWQREHAEFTKAYNRLVEEEGLPLAPFRVFGQLDVPPATP